MRRATKGSEDIEVYEGPDVVTARVVWRCLDRPPQENDTRAGVVEGSSSGSPLKEVEDSRRGKIMTGHSTREPKHKEVAQDSCDWTVGADAERRGP